MNGYYQIERDGEVLPEQVASPSFLDTILIGDHSYRVRAVDAAGNEGDWSPSVGASTLPFHSVVYVFPASTRVQQSVAVALRLEDYLRENHESSEDGNEYSITGLDSGPLFKVREGSGAIGDEPVFSAAKVIFPDDEKPGVPFVRIAQVIPQGSPMPWGEDEEVTQWQVTIDCDASEYSDVVTENENPAGADAVLSNAVWSLVTHFEAMGKAGFVNADATTGALDIRGVEFRIPITVTFETYTSTV